MFERIGRIIIQTSKSVTYAGRVAIIIIMLLVVADVTLRFLLNQPIRGVIEIVAYLLCILVFSALAWTEAEKSHITIPIFFDRLPPRIQPVVSLFINILSFSILGLICWRSFVFAQDQRLGGYISAVLYIPTFPFVYIVCLGSALYALAVLVNLIKSLQKSEK